MINFDKDSRLWKTRLQNCHRPEEAKEIKQLSAIWYPWMDPRKEKSYVI